MYAGSFKRAIGSTVSPFFEKCHRISLQTDLFQAHNNTSLESRRIMIHIIGELLSSKHKFIAAVLISRFILD